MTANTKPCSTGSRRVVQETELISRRWLSKKAFEIEFSRPSGFQFTAGQTIRFVHGDIERYYSPVSAPTDPTLTLCVRIIEGGNFTPTLATVDIGTRFRMTGPYGRKHPSKREYDFYLCGRDKMVREVTLLIDDYFPLSRVFVEVFF